MHHFFERSLGAWLPWMYKRYNHPFASDQKESSSCVQPIITLDRCFGKIWRTLLRCRHFTAANFVFEKWTWKMYFYKKRWFWFALTKLTDNKVINNVNNIAISSSHFPRFMFVHPFKSTRAIHFGTHSNAKLVIVYLIVYVYIQCVRIIQAKIIHTNIYEFKVLCYTTPFIVDKPF